MKLEIHRLELSLKAELQRLEAHTVQRFADVDIRFAEVNQRVAEKAAETIKWLVGVSFAQAGLIIAILKLHG